ncbi:MAG: transcriptional repressor LexA [Candidatus Sumerlaeia bacterium]|nr:transcriptional repressor LexA [Candidatus Sumerlaeia bacterium]
MYLTKRQREIYNYIRKYIRKNGYAPTLEEIGEGVGISSLATVHKHLKNMEKKGVIQRTWNRVRSIELISNQVQLQSIELPVLGVVAAGSPIEAIEERQWLAVPQELVKGGETFVLRVNGNSMIDEQIRDGDYIIVERRSLAENGEMVVALIDNHEATVKKFYREANGKIRLQPANPQVKPLILEEERVEIKGIVVGLLRKY